MYTMCGEEINMRLGEKQKLRVVKRVDFGVYLGDEQERVLLPKKQVPDPCQIGDEIEVFIYRDSSDRPIATTTEPYVTLHRPAYLEVKELGKHGAFLDWGLEKDLFLPYREQTVRVKPGQRYLVVLYIDKSDRLCATMKVHAYLRSDSPLHKEDRVEAVVYGISPTAGAFVAVEQEYIGLIPKKEMTSEPSVGDRIHGRIASVLADGKLVVSMRERVELQMDIDAAYIMKKINDNGGILHVSDRSDPIEIKEQLSMSKAAFKRAVGRLMKQGYIRQESGSLIRLRSESQTL